VPFKDEVEALVRKMLASFAAAVPCLCTAGEGEEGLLLGGEASDFRRALSEVDGVGE